MNKKRRLLLVMVILTLIFIFGQSLLDQETSIKESDVVKENIVQPVHEAVTGNSIMPHDIRDIAHIVEFSILGLEIVLLLRDKRFLLRLRRTISYCGFVALIDESIQYFSGRAPQVVDIWYDIIGSVIGAFIGVLFILLINRLRQRNTR